MSLLMEARDIRASWDKREVLKGVSLSVPAGSVTALIGPNGSGKSTFLAILAGLKAQDGGTVRLAGTDVSHLGRKDFARSVAFVSQTEHSAWPFTVAETVLTGRFPYTSWTGGYRKEDVEAAEEALAVMELGELRDRPVTSLSGGEFQRVRLARALAQHPKALILDEPATGLDMRFQHTLMEFIRTFASNGPSVIVTIHDLNTAALYADSITLLSSGRAAASGTPEDVFREDILSEVYGIRVRVSLHPVLGKPQAEPEYLPQVFPKPI